MIKISQIQELWSKNKRLKQLASDLLLIGFTWIISRYFFIGTSTRDNLLISNILSVIFFVQTLSIYYFFSINVFPKYLYTKKIPQFLGCFLLCFLIIYWSNYFSIQKLLPFSDGFEPGKYKDVWIQKIYSLLLRDVGWFGCFTNPKVASWNLGYSFVLPVVYLSIKYFRDTISIQKKILTLEKDNFALERDNLALELDFLKSQINPHFLFNTLNSIYTRTVDIDEQASDLVLKLSDLMRYSLYGVNEEKVPLSEELEYIQNYLDLEKYRHSEELVNISFAMDGTTAGYKIAPLLLISFVENAFKHGVNLSRKSSYVYVSAVIEDGILYFTVQNSLPDQLKNTSGNSSSKKSGGIGLVNTHKRLNLLYPDLYKLTSHKTEDEYEVMISIKLDVA